jgi:hypothetical protein
VQVVLERRRTAVVESYLRKVGGSCNHWQPRAVSMATDKRPANRRKRPALN